MKIIKSLVAVGILALGLVGSAHSADATGVSQQYMIHVPGVHVRFESGGHKGSSYGGTFAFSYSADIKGEYMFSINGPTTGKYSAHAEVLDVEEQTIHQQMQVLYYRNPIKGESKVVGSNPFPSATFVAIAMTRNHKSYLVSLMDTNPVITTWQYDLKKAEVILHAVEAR